MHCVSGTDAGPQDLQTALWEQTPQRTPAGWPQGCADLVLRVRCVSDVCAVCEWRVCGVWVTCVLCVVREWRVCVGCATSGMRTVCLIRVSVCAVYRVCGVDYELCAVRVVCVECAVQAVRCGGCAVQCEVECGPSRQSMCVWSVSITNGCTFSVADSISSSRIFMYILYSDHRWVFLYASRMCGPVVRFRNKFRNTTRKQICSCGVNMCRYLDRVVWTLYGRFDIDAFTLGTRVCIFSISRAISWLHFPANITQWLHLSSYVLSLSQESTKAHVVGSDLPL